MLLITVRICIPDCAQRKLLLDSICTRGRSSALSAASHRCYPYRPGRIFPDTVDIITTRGFNVSSMRRMSKHAVVVRYRSLTLVEGHFVVFKCAISLRTRLRPSNVVLAGIWDRLVLRTKSAELIICVLSSSSVLLCRILLREPRTCCPRAESFSVEWSQYWFETGDRGQNDNKAYD